MRLHDIALMVTALSGVAMSQQPAAASRPTSKPTQPASSVAPARRIIKKVDHGQIEMHGDLRLVRLFGTPQQRGKAHGELLGEEIVRLMRAELDANFGRMPHVLAFARGQLETLVLYPEDVEDELRAMFSVIKKQKIDLTLKSFKRKLDFKDVMLVNALDIFAMLACSGFTVWGDEVAGGGVLTTRNFDWPISGPHLTKNCVLMVQHPDKGLATASVAWPGYIGIVTGINEKGVAAFLHQGNAKRTRRPRPESMPTATAARCILERADSGNAFDLAKKALAETSPPQGYITRVVLPNVPNGGSPVRVFETSAKKVSMRDGKVRCVVTNHFLTSDKLKVFFDTKQRFTLLGDGLKTTLGEDDKKVSPAEAWQVLAKVQRSGRRFATLHSVLFRADPWIFEVALGQYQGAKMVGAPVSKLRYCLTRKAVFSR